MKATNPISRRLVTVQEAAAYTGLSPHTLYTMVSQRRVPYVKLGRLTKFDLGQLEQWIEAHTVRPVAPRMV
ncbi:helix-turn-helix domain-containing protein [Nitrospira sp. BLG_1]|uniref:helix-turn-helix domain-containing protein n=1 Tax=Nitrospira sp. BLG_1 TaxID=3395883 RepID=UPI0039BCC88F